ncbi:MAG: hypothetical protein LIO86_14715 [Lachnospiraceae bacterium]|nr:hypothetical protein [Lachnospiraceae bacterium]
MIYLYIPGHAGFGNQLFMYAKAYAVARDLGEQITIINLTTYDDEHPFLLKKTEAGPDCAEGVFDRSYLQPAVPFSDLPVDGFSAAAHSLL